MTATPPTLPSPPPHQTHLPAAPVPARASGRRRRSGWVVGAIALIVIAVAVAIGVVVAGLAIRDEAGPGSDGPPAGPVTVETLDPPPTKAERRLLSFIPFATEVSGADVSWHARADCERRSLAADVVAGFGCDLTRSGAETVAYSLFGSQHALERAYAAEVEASGVEPYTGSCKRGGPGEGNWQSGFSDAIGSVLPDGRVLCYERDGATVFVWTNLDLRVLATASSSGDVKALHRFWSTEAGPFD